MALGSQVNFLKTGDTMTGRLLLDLASDIQAIIVQGDAAQTINLQEWQNSAGTILSFLDKDGDLVVGETTQQANAGSFQASGYLTLKEDAGDPTADSGYVKIWSKSDNNLYFQDGDGEIHLIHGGPTFLTESATTQGLGANPDVYLFGFYEFAAANPGLNQGGATQVFGDANVSHASHAFIVASGAGAAASGVVEIRVTGTSITDAGARTEGDNETLIADITTAGANTYYETSKKWLGAVTFELNITDGTPATYSLDLNYGLAKYEDAMGTDFTVTSVQATGLAGAADNDFNIQLHHHDPDGTWAYSAAAFTPFNAGNLIASLVTDHSTDDKLASGDHFAWKRTGLSIDVLGATTDGIIALIESSANNAVEYLNLRVGIEY